MAPLSQNLKPPANSVQFTQPEMLWDSSLWISKQVEMVVAYKAGARARDYSGARIYAQVGAIQVAGEKFDAIHQTIMMKHGAEKASELQATVNCVITKVRPIVDRGQNWDKPAFDDE